MNREEDMSTGSRWALEHDMQQLRDYMAEIDLGPPVTAFYDLYVRDYNKYVPKFEPTNICITIGLISDKFGDDVPYRVTHQNSHLITWLHNIENVSLVNGKFFKHSRRRLDNALNDVKLTIISGVY